MTITQDDLDNLRTELHAEIAALRAELQPAAPEPTISPSDAKAIWLRGLADWSPSKTYVVGEIVKHGGRTWIALPDVAVGYAPDDVPGGWEAFDPYE